MSKNITALVDLDFSKYSVASVGETRFIDVTHKPSGRIKRFNNVTEFYGRNKKGGWLAETNKDRDSPFELSEFEIIQGREVTEPIENVLHSAKLSVEGSVKRSGSSKAKYYIGKGDSFRVELSTLKEYKGNRLDKPLLLDEVVEYLEKKFKPEIVTGYEVDDILCMEGFKDPDNTVVVGNDKDYKSCPIRYFDAAKEGAKVLDCRGFGELYRDGKGKVRGHGRLFKCHQIISEDSCDNYKANCFSDIKWGEVAAYNALKDCKDDKEAWEVMVGVFKHLYPEPKEVIGWRGDTILIDHMHVFQEMVNMAHLHRWENDFLKVTDILDKMDIKYEN